MFFISRNKMEVIHVAGHEKENKNILKHPNKKVYAVEVSKENPYLKIDMEGKTKENLDESWGDVS